MFFGGFKSKFSHNFRLFCMASLRTRRKKSARHHIWCLLIKYRLFFFFDGTLSLLSLSLTRESESTFGSFPAREKNVYRFSSLRWKYQMCSLFAQKITNTIINVSALFVLLSLSWEKVNERKWKHFWFFSCEGKERKNVLSFCDEKLICAVCSHKKSPTQ